MALASEALVYEGKVMTAKEFFKNEVRIAIERWDLEDGVRTLTQIHFEPDLFNASAYLVEQIEFWKGNAPEDERPKFELRYADKYGNVIC